MAYDRMKLAGFNLLLTIFLPAASLAQDNKDSIDYRIKLINTEYAEINKAAASFRVERKNVYGQSSEGGQLEKYYDDKTLRKAVLTLYGETGKIISEYYFMNAELILVNDKEARYKSAIYEGKPEIKSTEENKYYFNNKRLIRWIGNDGKTQDAVLYFEKEDQLLDDLKIIL
jgi:hypothetical protein